MMEDIPNPDDDNSETCERAIREVCRIRESECLYLMSKLGIDPNGINAGRRLISFAYRSKRFYEYINNNSEKEEDLSECIEMIRRVNKKPNQLIEFQVYLNEIGELYDKVYINELD